MNGEWIPACTWIQEGKIMEHYVVKFFSLGHFEWALFEITSFWSLIFSFSAGLELKFSLANKMMSSNPLCCLQWCLLLFPWNVEVKELFSSLFFSFSPRSELKFSLANKMISSNPLCSLQWCLLTFPWNLQVKEPWTKNYP